MSYAIGMLDANFFKTQGITSLPNRKSNPPSKQGKSFWLRMPRSQV